MSASSRTLRIGGRVIPIADSRIDLLRNPTSASSLLENGEVSFSLEFDVSEAERDFISALHAEVERIERVESIVRVWYGPKGLDEGRPWEIQVGDGEVRRAREVVVASPTVVFGPDRHSGKFVAVVREAAALVWCGDRVAVV